MADNSYQSDDFSREKSAFEMKKPSFDLALLKRIKLLPKVLTKREATLIRLLGAVALITLGIIINSWYQKNSAVVPAPGGEYIEAIIGSPTLINPIFAQANEVDQDITRLLFNGLLKQKSGELVPDLAESFHVSDDERTYTFTLKKNILWHDGSPLSAEDIVFTVETIQNPEFKSPLQGSLSGVLARRIDDKTISFSLSEPFAPFLSLLTFGILPKHIWAQIPPDTARLADFNTKTPIGTGPFTIKSLKRDSRGVIKSYTFVRNEQFFGSLPYLDSITLKFYPDFESARDSLQSGNSDGINYLPTQYHEEITNKDITIHSLTLPQYSGVFFNTNTNPQLKELTIRKALALGLNRDELIHNALNDDAQAIYGPLLPGFIGYNPDIQKYLFDQEQAEQLIVNAGWKKITAQEYEELIKAEESENQETKITATGDSEDTDRATGNDTTDTDSSPSDTPTDTTVDADTEDTSTENQQPSDASVQQEEPTAVQDHFWEKDDDILSITLTTVDNPETTRSAALIKKQWEQIGIRVAVVIIPRDDFLADIVTPRNYQALLLGQIIGNDPDPYAFWHSSQIESPGVNLSLYKNEKVDVLLEEARKTTDPNEREQKYIEFQNILKTDIPALFLYTPTYPYVLHNDINGFTITRITIPADRFSTINEWYRKTKRTLTP